VPRYSIYAQTAPTTACFARITGTTNRELVLDFLSAGIVVTTNVVGRTTLSRVTTDGTMTAQTPEQYSTRSPVFHGTVGVAATADPATTGSPLLILSNQTNPRRYGRWVPPRPNAGVYLIDDERVALFKADTASAQAYSLSFRDVIREPNGRRVPRRSRHRTGFMTGSRAVQLRVGTTPVSTIPYAHAYYDDRWWIERLGSVFGDRLLPLDGGGGGGDATVNPGVIAVTTTVPQPAVSVGAAPAAVAATTTVPPVAIPATVLPATIAATTTVGDPDVSVGAAPAAVAAVTTVPTPAAGQSGGGDATATPATVATAVSVGAPTVSVGAGPASVAVIAAVGAPTVSVGATPAVVAVIAFVHQPTVATEAPSVGGTHRAHLDGARHSATADVEDRHAAITIAGRHTVELGGDRHTADLVGGHGVRFEE
jgi:hypothetical protein